MITPAERKHTEVAVGVLIRESDGALLITSRPEGKPRAGWWEFPGGKLEASETVEQEMREGQQMAWQQLPLHVRPVLEGSLPVLQWLSEERGLPFDASVYAVPEL